MASTMAEYVPDRRFRVVREGAALVGMVPAGPGVWKRRRVELPPGTVITCLGRGQSWGSDGVPIIVWGDERGEAFAPDAEFCPGEADIWSGCPAPGYLEPQR
jgi:hypothetical protein